MLKRKQHAKEIMASRKLFLVNGLVGFCAAGLSAIR